MKQTTQVGRDRLRDYPKRVRVFGIRKEKFLEFDFTVGFEELTIELVMPYAAFKEFCETNHVAKIDCLPEIKPGFDKLAQGRLPALMKEENIAEQADLIPGNQTKIIKLGEYK